MRPALLTPDPRTDPPCACRKPAPDRLPCARTEIAASSPIYRLRAGSR
jgi:hypothetical protein